MILKHPIITIVETKLSYNRITNLVTTAEWCTMLKAQNLYSLLRVDPIQLTLLY